MNTLSIDSSTNRLWFVKNVDTGEMVIPSENTRAAARLLRRMINSTGVATRIGSFSNPEINHRG